MSNVRQHEERRLHRTGILQMTNPNWGDFVVRVGGVALIFVLAILFAKSYYPGHETTAVLIVSGGVFVLLSLRYCLRRSKRKANRARR